MRVVRFSVQSNDFDASLRIPNNFNPRFLRSSRSSRLDWELNSRKTIRIRDERCEMQVKAVHVDPSTFDFSHFNDLVRSLMERASDFQPQHLTHALIGYWYLMLQSLTDALHHAHKARN